MNGRGGDAILSLDETPATFKNHFTQAVRDFKPGQQKGSTPGFADDAMYHYYTGIAKHGGMTRPLALKPAFDAFTHPLLWQMYHDDGPVPPGMNRFDLLTLNFVDARPERPASRKKGPFGGPDSGRLAHGSARHGRLRLGLAGDGERRGVWGHRRPSRGSGGGHYRQEVSARREILAGTRTRCRIARLARRISAARLYPHRHRLR